MAQLDGVAAALPDRSFGIRRLVEQAQEAAQIRLRVAMECMANDAGMKIPIASEYRLA